MVIVYDLMTDSKINLIHHQYEVQAIEFSPPGSANSPSGGDFLLTIDYNTNDANDITSTYSGTMCLWNWARGECIQQVQIPRSQNISVLQGIGVRPSAKVSDRVFKICFDKVGGIFVVLESSPEQYGGGYRVSFWNLGRYQKLELISQ